MKLRELGYKYNTDKVGVHTFNNKTMLDNYEMYFSSIKDKPITFLELGILNGSSLKVWEDFFSNGKIIGLDIEPSKKQYKTNKTEIYIGSQNDPLIIDKIIKDYPEGLDVVIDDASHLNELTISSFELIFPFVKPGGYYIIEDTHCTYGTDTDPNFESNSRSWPGMELNEPKTNFRNTRKTFLDFILPKIEDLDNKKGDIFCIHFFSETLVIKKTNK
jgi:cephalosporin hydroxylase